MCTPPPADGKVAPPRYPQGVAEWAENPTVEAGNDHRMQAVTWEEYVSALEREVVALSADSDRPKVLLKTCRTAWRDGV